MMAAQQGDCDMVSLLLDHQAIDANLQDEVFLSGKYLIHVWCWKPATAGPSGMLFFVASFLKLAAFIFKFWMFFDLLMVMCRMGIPR